MSILEIFPTKCDWALFVPPRASFARLHPFETAGHAQSGKPDGRNRGKVSPFQEMEMESEMEEHDPAQKPERDRSMPGGRPEPTTPSVAPSTEKPTGRERDYIAAGQRKAERDEEKLREAGFGSQIGKE